MKLQPFLLDQWLAQPAASTVEFHLGGSTGPHWTLRELLALDGDDARDRLLDADVVYRPPAGGPGLRRAIAEMRDVPEEHVLVVAGGSEALLHVFFLAAEPGANVIVPFPGFSPYHAVPASLGCDVRTYHLRPEHGYRIDIDEVARLTDARTKLLLVNSPHNPTGAVLTDEDMRALHDFAAERGIQFVCDEVFHPIYFGREMASAAALPRATVIGDASKALALSGLRVGWIIEPDRVRREHYLNAREYFSISNTTAGEFFAEIAVRHRDVVLKRTRDVAGTNLKLLHRLLADQAGALDCVRPSGGMTAWLRLVNGADARGFCQAALGQGLLLTPGDCFGVPDHFRLGFGASTEWFPRAMERLAAFLHTWARTEPTGARMMPELSTLGVFVGAALVLLVTPGPAVLYIVTRSIQQGRVAGLVSVLGICAGTLFHVAAAALGISALLLSSALAFDVLRYVGAAYLIVLGVRTLLTRDVPRADRRMEGAASLRRIFMQGVVVNLLNPHTALFFFAFLPQFVVPSRGVAPVQIVTLGLLFIAMSATTDAAWAIAAGTAGDWIKRSPKFAQGYSARP